MSVSTTVRFGQDLHLRQRVFPQLPKGVTPFVGGGTVLGDSSGTNLTVDFQFNPDSLDNWQPYVAIDTISVQATVANPLNGRVFVDASSWEDVPTNVTRYLATLVPLLTSATTFGAIDTQVHYLGRILKSSTGSIPMRFVNVDTSLLDISITGWLATFPFQPPTTLRA